MKSLLLLTALFVAGVSFGQSKKEQIDILTNRVDSLNTVLSTTRDNASKDIGALNSTIDGLNSEIAQLKNDISTLESSVSTLEKDKSKLTRENEKLKTDLEEMSKKNLELEAKLSVNFDFSNGKFSENIIQFIKEYFSTSLTARGEKVIFHRTPNEIIIQVEGELGYVPSYSINTMYNTKLAGDIDKDGQNEILFQVEHSEGGTYAWREYYCLKLFSESNFELFECKIQCPCAFDCGESFFPELIDVKANVLVFEIACFTEDDALCCPSSNIQVEYVFNDNLLIPLN